MFVDANDMPEKGSIGNRIPLSKTGFSLRLQKLK